jgi:hypothetical protein
MTGAFRTLSSRCRTSSSSPTPSAPPSRPLAATLVGGLRPGSLRVPAPCRDPGHGSRLGFPGRRLPRGPAASGDVAPDLRVLSLRRERDPSQRVAEAEARLPAGEFRNRQFYFQSYFSINGALILRGQAGEVSDRTRGPRPGGEMRHRQWFFPLMRMRWCVSSPRTDGHAADRTRRFRLAPPVGFAGGDPGRTSRSGSPSRDLGQARCRLLRKGPLLALSDFGRWTLDVTAQEKRRRPGW